MKDFMWFIIEICVAIVLASIMIGLVLWSEHFNGFFRGVLAMIGAMWFVGKLKEK
jgi:hypothetical protein